MNNKVGRPLLFQDKETLEALIASYFNSCFKDTWEDEDMRDENGDIILGDNGKPKQTHVKVRKQIKPISITGLAVALDTSRHTLLNYEEREEFFTTIKKAKDFIENCLEDGMLKGQINPTAGIFNAKNNFGWVDKIDTDITAKVESVNNLKDLTDAELFSHKQKLLSEIERSGFGTNQSRDGEAQS